VANLLTTIRLTIVVPTAVGFARPDLVPSLMLAGFVAAAIATDYFDGVIARRFGTATARGQLFDHTADFLFVTCGLAGAAVGGIIPWILPALIVVAFSQYVLDSYFFDHTKRLRMSVIGRWNGILYFVPLVAISLSRLGFADNAEVALSSLWMVLSYLLIASTVVSIADRAFAPRQAAGQGEISSR